MSDEPEVKDGQEEGATAEEETTDTDSAEADGGDTNRGEAPNTCVACEG